LVAVDVMTRFPTTIRENNTVRDALKTIHDLDVRHLPVVNDDRELVGIISDRDLHRPPPVDLDPLGSRWLDLPIANIMSSDVLTVTTESGLREIVALMLDQKVGAVPVLSPDGALVGIVSYIDLLRELEKEL